MFFQRNWSVSFCKYVIVSRLFGDFHDLHSFSVQHQTQMLFQYLLVIRKEQLRKLTFSFRTTKQNMSWKTPHPSTSIMGILRYPAKATLPPTQKKGLIKILWREKMMVNNLLTRSYVLLDGSFGGYLKFPWIQFPFCSFMKLAKESMHLTSAQEDAIVESC